MHDHAKRESESRRKLSSIFRDHRDVCITTNATQGSK
ncbi:hypothetical protein KPSA1_02099 [Pseudomonas syringae pv. actinidiae]|uniref:Uncharacterized protein n=1 Tax=Pseudomonas syringae pv. actinidiae TaxID=103796 RepID=A0A2V0QJF9_PSESF|nr:hypothetical protein KPSA1_02099 [Pseudomonas syringae pv. actinidiae]